MKAGILTGGIHTWRETEFAKIQREKERRNCKENVLRDNALAKAKREISTPKEVEATGARGDAWLFVCKACLV